MQITRRIFLRGSAAGAAAVAVLPWQAGCGEGPPKIYNIFLHGVASGDPLADAFIIWSRVSTATEATDVSWEVATDSGFGHVVASGSATALPERDYCIKIDVTGLAAGVTHYYRFEALGETSPVGRARTLPPDGAKHARFALAACSSYAHGYFHGYREIAERNDLDALIHLGDYLYEYADNAFGTVRNYDPPHECTTLDDYRRRYAHYRRDPNLRAVHESVALISVWDDHEFANDAFPGGADNHNPGEGTWEARVAAALQAYHEWMPIRDGADPRRIFRSFSFGGLCDLIMLDTRMWGRDMQAAPASDKAMEETRTLLGLDQEMWLRDQLTQSTATWRLLGQQVMVGQLPQLPNNDAWDAYPKARARLLDVMTLAKGNLVVLTGDIHTTWVMDLTPDAMDPSQFDALTGAGSRAVEFIVPGITSAGLTEAFQETADAIVPSNPWVKYVDVWRRGYGILDLTPTRCEMTVHHFRNIAIEAPQQSSASFVATVESGKAFAKVKRL